MGAGNSIPAFGDFSGKNPGITKSAGSSWRSAFPTSWWKNTCPP